MAAEKRKKVGLALGGGAARGQAHIGVLEVLERENIPIDLIAGTSAGALVGAFYAQGKKATELKEIILDLDWKKRIRLIDLVLPRTGFIRGRKLKNMAKSIVGDVDFSGLKIPLACVATDIMTGEEVVIKEGSVLDAVRASISLPVILTAVKWRGRYLVDGGLVNQVPVSVVKEMGADFIIAVNVLPHLGKKVDELHLKEELGQLKEPSIFNIILQTINIPASRLVESNLNGADVVIEPIIPGIASGGDFRHARDYITHGEHVARDAIAEIKRRLNS